MIIGKHIFEKTKAPIDEKIEYLLQNSDLPIESFIPLVPSSVTLAQLKPFLLSEEGIDLRSAQLSDINELVKIQSAEIERLDDLYSKRF